MTAKELKLVEIHDLASMLKLFPLIRQLNAEISEADFRTRLTAMTEQGGYFQIACYFGETCVGLSGVWIGTQLWCGKFIEVDNFIVDQKNRELGVGRKMIEWIEAKGQSENCEMMRLDSYVTADGAHRFYFRHGFKVRGFHMTKDLQ
jgi:GNAT superfamily N-acetyltransferase